MNFYVRVSFVWKKSRQPGNGAHSPPPPRHYHILNYCYYYRVAPHFSLTALLHIVPYGDIRPHSEGLCLRDSL
jgi:hypothetical protein